MNILITESQFKRLVKNIINEKYPPVNREELDIKNDMEDNFVEIMKDVIEKPYKYGISYVDKNNYYVYMKHDKKTNYLWIDYSKLWSIFKSKYHLEYKEIQRFFKDMVGEHYNLWDVTPIQTNYVNHPMVGEHYNLWDVTPSLEIFPLS